MEKNWIECKNELPKENKPFMVWDDYHKMIKVAQYNPHYTCWDDEHGDDYYADGSGGKISHWMELPDRPIAQAFGLKSYNNSKWCSEN